MTREELFEKNKELAHSVVHSREWARPRWVSDADLHQIALTGLWKACVEYEPLRGKFSTFAYVFVRNEVMAECRYWGLKKRDAGRPASLDAIMDSGWEPAYLDAATAELADEREAKRGAIEKLLVYVTPRKRAILRYVFLDGHSFTEAAAKFGYLDGTRCKLNTLGKLKRVLREKTNLHCGPDQSRERRRQRSRSDGRGEGVDPEGLRSIVPAA